MSPAPDRRVEILEDLIELRVTGPEATRALHEMGWGEDEVVDLRPRHLLEVLRRYREGAMTASEVTAWADAVDLRDDIGRVSGTEDVVDDALLEMSSPELFTDLAEGAPGLVRRLEAAT